MYAKSNPSDARANNRRLLFRLLFPDRQLSRADLCKETGLSRATATDVTGEMINDGLLRELGSRKRDGRGKPGTLLAIDTDVLRLDMHRSVAPVCDDRCRDGSAGQNRGASRTCA